MGANPLQLPPVVEDGGIMSDRLEQQLGNYRLTRFIGRGGFADVYLGEHVHLKTQAAIKILHARLAKSDEDNFQQEALIIARLIHPNIVRILDFAIQDGTPFLVMDYAPNGTLRTRHPRGVPLSPTIILPYVKQVAAALQYAHDQRVIHRDIKPENMLLGSRNEVLLSDFGIAVVAASSRYHNPADVAGTIVYMAPEQIQAQPRPASDQYALAVIAYEWLSGKRLFDGPYNEIAIKHTVTAPPALRSQVPGIPPALEDVVMTALAKNPAARFGTIQAFATAFEQACQNEAWWQVADTQIINLSSPPSPTSPSGSYTPVISSPYFTPNISSSSATPVPSAPQIPSAPSAFNSESMPTIPGTLFTPPTQQVPPLAYTPTPPSGPPPFTGPHPAINFAPESPPFSPPGTVPSGGYPYGIAQPNSSATPSPVAGGVPPPNTPAPTAPPAPSQRHISRRVVVGGIIGLAGLAATGGGATWLILSHKQGTPALEPTRVPLPTGALYIYRGHAAAVWSLAWSPDGSRIASVSQDQTAQVWDATTGNHVLKYHKHIDTVRAVAWSPNGAQIVSGGHDHSAQVWDPHTGARSVIYYGHSNWVLALAWSSDSKYVVSGGADHTAQVWAAGVGSHILTYTGHGGYVQALAWSPNGTRIASGSGDHTVQIWDATTGRHPLTYKGHKDLVNGVAWSPNGSQIASASSDKTVQVWDATTLKPLLTYSGHTDAVNSVAWSADGKYIASGSSDHTVQVWDAVTGTLVFTYRGHTGPVTFGVAWQTAGNTVASASVDKTVQVWRPA